MPIIKSAKKRVRLAKKATARNARVKRSLRIAVKAFQTSVSSKKNVSESLAAANSAIDKASKKNLMSKKKAARRKSRLNAAAKKAGVGRATTKKAPKAPAKKAVAKKSPAKKGPKAS